MDSLRELVRSLAVIIILTSFIEMILPDAQMKRYTRLILGLFVILLILNPVLVFLDDGSGFAAQGWASPDDSSRLEEILDDAQQISGQSQEAAIKQYAGRLEQQISALVKLAPEVEDARVVVKLEDNAAQLASGSISQVTVTANIKKESKEEDTDSAAGIADINIGSGTEKTPAQKQNSVSQEQIERRIQSIIGDFYGLTAGQVLVKLEN